MPTPIPDRLAALRSRMQQLHLDAYLIPSSDPHQSEYVAPHWKSREWISGFTGSSGLLVVTADHAGLWTDSRYFLQAESELAGSGIELHRQVVPHAPEHVPWLAGHLPPGAAVGLDGFLFSEQQIRFMERHFQPRGIHLMTQFDLISAIWAERPPLPLTPVYEHPLAFAGRSRSQKLQLIRQGMAERGADAHLIPTLDDIAWTLNIRSADVDYNPVAYAYLVVTTTGGVLFIDRRKVPDQLLLNLQRDQILLKPYEDLLPFLEQLPAGQRLLVDPGSTSVRLLQALPPGRQITGPLLPQGLKAVKNEVETGHIRQAMIKDGIALTQALRWLEAQHRQGQAPTEAGLAAQLAACRSRQPHYVSESFPAIVGYQANGAIIHYRPPAQGSAPILPEGLLLLDSGGQYLDGTTDITRTIALGEPTGQQQEHFTLVLKGHIALDQLQFPEGTAGGQLDAFARQFLWQHGLNYGHGTGHGVGFFLNVHEPPQGFAASVVTSRGSALLEAGMVTSNEPGFYLPGQYGIRIENLLLCVEKQTTELGTFLGFETLTLFPIDARLLKVEWLEDGELRWLNDYHGKVLEALSPHLEQAGRQWLAEKCRPVSK